MIYKIFFLIFYLASVVHAENINEYLSQTLYAWKMGRSCGNDIRSLAFQKDDPQPLCKISEFFPTNNIRDVTPALNDNLFFDEASREFLNRNKCWETKVNGLDENKKKLLVEDINSKLPFVKALKAEVLKVRKERYDYIKQFASTQNEVRNREHQAQLDNFKRKETELKANLNALLSSTWFGDHFIAKELIMSLVDKATNLEMNGLESLILKPMLEISHKEQLNLLRASNLGIPVDQNYRNIRNRYGVFMNPQTIIKKNRELDQKELADLSKLNPDRLSFDLNDDQKVMLFRENGLGKYLFKSSASEFYHNTDIMCRLEGKYGEGRTSLEHVETGTVLALGVIVPMAPFLAVARGLMTLQTAEAISIMTATGITGLGSYQQIMSSCPHSDNNIRLSSTCETSKLSTSDFASQIKKSNCVLNVVLASLPFVSVAATKLIKHIAELLNIAKSGQSKLTASLIAAEEDAAVAEQALTSGANNARSNWRQDLTDIEVDYPDSSYERVPKGKVQSSLNGFIIRSRDGTARLFKPCLPTGVSNCYYDVFASLLDKFIGLNAVADTRLHLTDLPTDLRKDEFISQAHKILGASQTYFPDAIQDPDLMKIAKKTDLNRQEIIDFILGSVDREHQEHQFVFTKDGHLQSTNNSQAFEVSHPVLSNRALYFMQSPEGLALINRLKSISEQDLEKFVTKPGIQSADQKLVIERLRFLRDLNPHSRLD